MVEQAFLPVQGTDKNVCPTTGVMLEGERYGFTVIHLNPNDEYWQDSLQRILDNINRVKKETAYDRHRAFAGT